MTTEEVAALSLQMLGDFPTICLCARFMLVIVRQGKVSGVYVWTALVAVAWIFLAKIGSGSMKCFLENLFTGMEVHTLVGGCSSSFHSRSTSRSHSRLKTCSVAEHGPLCLCPLSLRYCGVPQGAGQWTVRRV